MHPCRNKRRNWKHRHKKTPQGFLLIPGKREDFLKEFKKLITSEPKRKGKPKLATPEEIKSVWRIVK